MDDTETRSFLSFIPFMLRSEIPSSPISRNSMLKMKKSNGYFRNNDYKSGAKSNQKQKHFTNSDAYYHNCLKLYHNFFKRSPLLPKDSFKKWISRALNIPRIIKSMDGQYSDIEDAFFEFIRIHKCGNKNCNRFATSKCSGCLNVRYCDAKCQEMDFKKHSKLCPSLKQEKERFLYVGKILQREIRKRNSRERGVKLISFESFLSILLSKVFLLFSDILKEKEYPKTAALLNIELQKRGLSDGNINLESLRSLRSDEMTSVGMSTLQYQLDTAWDGDHLLPRSLELACEEQEATEDKELASWPASDPGLRSLPNMILISILECLSWPSLALWLVWLYRPRDLDWMPWVDRFWIPTLLRLFLKAKNKITFTGFLLAHYWFYFQLINWIWDKSSVLGWMTCIAYLSFIVLYR